MTKMCQGFKKSINDIFHSIHKNMFQKKYVRAKGSLVQVDTMQFTTTRTQNLMTSLLDHR